MSDSIMHAIYSKSGHDKQCHTRLIVTQNA
jgi:hypothetical protein